MLCIEEFIKWTKFIREKLENQPTQVLLSYMPPHNPVASGATAQYVKLFLNLAEIDVSVYTLHSTRSSSSTKVKNLGLRLKDIQKTVGWSQKTTFSKLYKLPFKNNYGATLLLGYTVTQ